MAIRLQRLQWRGAHGRRHRWQSCRPSTDDAGHRGDLNPMLRWNCGAMLYAQSAREAERRGFNRIITDTRVDEDGASLRGLVGLARVSRVDEAGTPVGVLGLTGTLGSRSCVGPEPCGRSLYRDDGCPPRHRRATIGYSDRRREAASRRPVARGNQEGREQKGKRKSYRASTPESKMSHSSARPASVRIWFTTNSAATSASIASKRDDPLVSHLSPIFAPK
jgi:hypothetical protein